mgnify:FL=1
MVIVTGLDDILQDFRTDCQPKQWCIVYDRLYKTIRIENENTELNASEFILSFYDESPTHDSLREIIELIEGDEVKLYVKGLENV